MTTTHPTAFTTMEEALEYMSREFCSPPARALAAGARAGLAGRRLEESADYDREPRSHRSEMFERGYVIGMMRRLGEPPPREEFALAGGEEDADR